MDWYYYIALAAIILQMLFSIQMLKNYRYVMAKHKKQRSGYRPKTVLIVPCKGLDSTFELNITSFFAQDYENYLLCFVVQDRLDPAYPKLVELKEKLFADSKVRDVQILIAGQSKTCSQKVHNLLFCYEQLASDIEVMAFADSDACARPDWLSHIVYPLRLSKYGTASGYRWFVPKKNNPASLALSAVNAKIAQLLGNTSFNQAWGGSMAIKVEVFRKLGIDKIWQKALSDDLSLSYAVKKAGLRVAFVPACLVASYESTTWGQLFEFGRRQFLITRVSALRTWLFGLFSTLFAILGIWAAAALAIYAARISDENWYLYMLVPIIFFASQMARAIMRQTMITRILKKDVPKMRFAIVADVLFFWLWTILLLIFILSSAFGRIVTWRGIRYKLVGPTKTIILANES